MAAGLVLPDERLDGAVYDLSEVSNVDSPNANGNLAEYERTSESGSSSDTPIPSSSEDRNTDGGCLEEGAVGTESELWERRRGTPAIVIGNVEEAVVDSGFTVSQTDLKNLVNRLGKGIKRKRMQLHKARTIEQVVAISNELRRFELGFGPKVGARAVLTEASDRAHEILNLGVLARKKRKKFLIMKKIDDFPKFYQ